MSKVNYKHKPYTSYYVLYSYEDGTKLKSGIRISCSATSEDEAIAEAYECLLITYKPKFTANVIGKQIW